MSGAVEIARAERQARDRLVSAVESGEVTLTAFSAEIEGIPHLNVVAVAGGERWPVGEALASGGWGSVLDQLGLEVVPD